MTGFHCSVPARLAGGLQDTLAPGAAETPCWAGALSLPRLRTGGGLQAIQRTSHPLASAVEHVRVGHGGGFIRRAQRFRQGADVVPRRQQVGGEALAQGMAIRRLDQARIGGRLFYGLL